MVDTSYLCKETVSESSTWFNTARAFTRQGTVLCGLWFSAAVPSLCHLRGLATSCHSPYCFMVVTARLLEAHDEMECAITGHAVIYMDYALMEHCTTILGKIQKM